MQAGTPVPAGHSAGCQSCCLGVSTGVDSNASAVRQGVNFLRFCGYGWIWHASEETFPGKLSSCLLGPHAPSPIRRAEGDSILEANVADKVLWERRDQLSPDGRQAFAYRWLKCLPADTNSAWRPTPTHLSTRLRRISANAWAPLSLSSLHIGLTGPVRRQVGGSVLAAGMVQFLTATDTGLPRFTFPMANRTIHGPWRRLLMRPVSGNREGGRAMIGDTR
jgi:hypothetical protein